MSYLTWRLDRTAYQKMFVGCVGGVTGGQSRGGAVILPLFVPGVIMGTALFM